MTPGTDSSSSTLKTKQPESKPPSASDTSPSSEAQGDETALSGMSIVWHKPALLLSLVLLIAAVTVVSVMYLPGDYSMGRKLAAGVIGGGGFWLFVVTPRLIG